MILPSVPSLTLTVENFANAFGVNADQIPADIQKFIKVGDFDYEKLDAADRDRVILDVLKKIDSEALQKVGEHRKEVWEKGWQENLDAFGAKGMEGLVPRFIRPNQVIRLNKDYVKPNNPKFELDFFGVLRLWLFDRYFADADQVCEFGCGSGYNLVALAKRYPQIQLIGLDWAESAVELVNRVGKMHNLRLQGRRFDFFNPDSSINFGPRSVVVTMAALEQVGSRYDKFLDFLLQKTPNLVVNLEPLYELYDPTNMVDYLAMRYHKMRGYLDGYLSRLRKLEAERRIEIIQTHRPCFGSLFHEGYSLVVWRPLKG